MLDKLEQLDGEANDIFLRMGLEMERLWPKGSHVQFELRSGQKNWTTGTVLHHSGSRGVIIIRLDKEKSRNGMIRSGQHSVKHIHWRYMR